MKTTITLSAKLAIYFIFLSGVSTANAQFNITPGITAAQVATALAGQGLEVSNVTVNCSAQSYGSFNNGAAAGLGMGNGLVMTTGNAMTLIGNGNANNDFSFNAPNDFFPNDPQLTQAMNVNNVIDGCFIEFDVIPKCDNISITFVFGSDEYNDYVNANFNDGFGFFVTGPNPAGGNYNNLNVARLPNGTVVSIDNVNLGTNAGFYINNTPSASPNRFDGYTTVLTPDFDVTPCQEYHFKLAIGDAGDPNMDSGVLVNIITCSAPLQAQAATTPATCTNDGEATVTPSGGVGPYTYSWSPSGGNGATAENLPAGQYTVTVDDAITCQDSVVLNITIAGPPVPVMNVQSLTVCNTDQVNIPAFTSDPAGATFSWTNTTTDIGLGGNGNGNIAGFLGTNTGNTPLTGTITVTPTIGACVGNPVTFDITVNPTITPQFTQPADFCIGSAIPALPLNSTNNIAGNWAPAINNAATTEYTFTPNAGQCSVNQTLSITIIPQTLPDFANQEDYCQGSVVPALPLTSLNNISGNWAPAINNTATTQYTFTPDANECATTEDLTITIIIPADPTFTAVDSFCQGSAIPELLPTSDNGINGTWSPAINNNATTLYTFTPAADECANQTNMNIVIDLPVLPAFDALAALCLNDGVPVLPLSSTNGFSGTWEPATFESDEAGTFTSTFTPDAQHCATTADLSLVVNPLPVVTVNSVTVCPNVDATLDANGAVNYSWSPAQGLSADNTEIVTANVPSAQVFTVTGTDANGCQSAAQSTVSMSPPLVLVVTPDDAVICSGEEVTLTITGATNYSWTEDGTAAATPGNSITVSPTTTTSYTVDGEAEGCLATTNVTVTVNQQVLPDFQTVGPFCLESVMPGMPAVSTNGINGSWSPALNNTQTTEYTFTPTAGQCALPATMTIVIDMPVQTVFPPVDPFCEGADFAGMPSTDLNGINGSWSPSEISNMFSGTYSFIPDASECALGTSADIIVVPNPVALFQTNVSEIMLPLSTVTLTNTSTNAVTYEWNFGNGGTSTVFEGDYNYGDSPGNYTITLTAFNELGCPDQTTQTFRVIEDIFVWVPNAFTPDGDEYNNMFTPSISGDFDPYNFNMYIFDRWGTLIFETRNVEIGWDGYYKNKLVQDGVYTWKIDVKRKNGDKRESYTGSVVKMQ